MIFGFIMLVIIAILWVLLVEGALFRILLFAAGPVGVYFLMRIFVEGSDQTAVTINQYHFSLATTVSVIVLVLALLTTKAK